ncbi:MAG: UDP-forming cellulose synthase catalytic subunit [Methylococcaceae bacterium]|nr:UDP-forming cellulose synthase catalytic subunit [Methylococcaceae bacterium]
MKPGGLIGFLAGRLGVADPARIGSWLLRVFVLPPRMKQAGRQGESLSGNVAINRMIAVWAGALGVNDMLDPGAWILRIFILPPAREAGLTGWLQAGFVRARRWVSERFSPRRYARLVSRLETAGIEWMDTGGVALRIFLGLLAGSFLLLVITTPLNGGEQARFFLVTWMLALLVRRLPGDLPGVILIMLSFLAALRYGWWRITSSIPQGFGMDWLFGMVLLAAEIYTWLILVLGYVQTIMPLRRQPAPLPTDPGDWPTVDVFIPTYNEPLKVVKTTVYGAQSIDWPKDKLNVYLLDDGRREAFRQFAEQAGVGYIIRKDNAHAKAGNLNHALRLTKGEYIAVFDCDHIPTRAFLQLSMGWFLRDPHCAMAQTPHHFYSADAFERNLSTLYRVPSENTLFYRLVQDGNDLWNAAFFCGSCAILKPTPLEEIGGIAVETVTEDAHTALKLHRRGYNSVYLNIPLAAGLATESLASHIGQWIRWARGMVQIFRIDNPLLGRGLSFFQRLCYCNAMLYFFHGIPRLIFLLAPLAYLGFELHIIHAEAKVLVFYVLPYLVHAIMANARIQGQYRHSFWAEVYESVLAWYIAIPTTLALFKPKLGKFNVTSKGGLTELSFFDWAISKPYLLLLGCNLLGFLLGIGRLLWWNTREINVVLLNLAWVLFNLTLLGAALGVATEARQVRLSHRVAMRLPVSLYLPDGRVWACWTLDYSSGGLSLDFPKAQVLEVGQKVAVSLSRGDQEFTFPGQIVLAQGKRIGLRFADLSPQEEAWLTQCTFARADAWCNWVENQPPGRELAGFWEIVDSARYGYGQLLRRFVHTLRAPRGHDG